MLAIPTCPPIPRLTLLPMSIFATIVLVGELALLVAALRRVLHGASTSAAGLGVVAATTVVGALALSVLTYIVFLALHDNSFLLAGCAILIGDTAAEHDIHLFHEMEAAILVLTLIGAASTAVGLICARAASRR